jgi:prophage regulatory protein
MPVTEASHRERGQSLPADVIEVVVRDCLDLRHCLETLFRFEALGGMMRLGRFLPGRSLRMDRAGGGRCGGRAKRPQPEIGESDKPQLGGEGEVSELMQSMRIGLIDLRDSLRAMGRPMRVVAVPAVPGMQAVPLKKPGQGRPARHAQVNTSSRGEHDQQAPKPEEAGDVTLIRLPEVLAITGLKKTSIYQKMEVNRFPAQVPLGARAVGWVKSEVQRWAEERIQSRTDGGK